MKATPGRNFGAMDFSLYAKIVDDLGEFGERLNLLRLYKDGEPLANPRFADMVSYARKSGFVRDIDTTTNAILLTPKRSEEIIAAGITRINISIYGMTTEQYQRFSHRAVDIDKLVANIKHLYEIRGNTILFVKINADVVPSKDEVKRFLDTFGDICDKIYVEHVMNCWSDFGYEEHGVKVNQDVGIYGQPIQEVLTCPYVMYSFSINSDGTASTCFLDWHRKLVIGDARTHSVKSIWEGAKLRAHQMMMLRGDRKSHPVCGSCGQLTHGDPDDIDAHRERLIPEYEALWNSTATKHIA